MVDGQTSLWKWVAFDAMHQASGEGHRFSDESDCCLRRKLDSFQYFFYTGDFLYELL